MTSVTNQYGQPVGADLPDWTPRSLPPRIILDGQYCRLEPIDVDKHAADLYAAFALAPDGRDWTYMFAEPFSDFDSYLHHAQSMAASQDPLHFAVIDKTTDRAVGTLSLMRIDPQHGAIEVGHVAFSPLLKQTAMATEAHYLLMKLAFDQLGYRRYEWKCDSCNLPSRKAALRLGFQFEGLFRQALVYKGRTRDTCWFSIIDGEWPVVKQALESWLDRRNFDSEGQQIQSLQSLRQG
ncbi:GNAT family N-acetyltransferase [Erwiniaceae bacterium BAC15a-03b]|uniref:GNAT family N-acetyltransferase n=1 Tax=Winslowiella arboricola TaxID=2978220 RepID=A0A9J6PLY0_9GAMM|nr:GNAT family protein [Winslowiella arboricola]MCU5773715.1 GNAT family N-acetyltransferase [Winslowiella arboricola]MCU5778386.1 GNAT family N-acetyltransferase [Winslowiella arboricola]